MRATPFFPQGGKRKTFPPLPNLSIRRGIPSFRTRRSACSSFETNTVPPAKVRDKKGFQPLRKDRKP
ncbi:hypothetical protein C1O50_03005 [Akkermansia muciniphila]|nr:hypothetical protein C1O50_03005 [Akkermansia muciniphila]